MISSIKLFDIKVIGPVPKKSRIWDRSHVTRDRSHLDGTSTPRTHSLVKYNHTHIHINALSIAWILSRKPACHQDTQPEAAHNYEHGQHTQHLQCQASGSRKKGPATATDGTKSKFKV
jgi:hypothetical protein